MSIKHYPHPKIRRGIRVRSKITGTAAKPRLSVFRSGQHLHAQLIDDQKGKTLLAGSTFGLKEKKTKTEKATLLGQKLGEQILKAKINQAVLDRGHYRFHGRIKTFTDSLRQQGLKI